MSKHAQFFSRRNQVILHNENHQYTVEKIFEDNDSYIVERDFYLSTQLGIQPKIPKLLAYDDQKKILMLEHIKGELLTDVLGYCEENNDTEQACIWLNMAISWLLSFHDLPQVLEKKWVIHDINLRNFIISENKIYGFDFEQLREGSKERDLVRLIAMYLHEDPIGSEFKKRILQTLKGDLMNRLDLDEKMYDEILKDEIEILQSRRGKKKKE